MVESTTVRVALPSTPIPPPSCDPLFEIVESLIIAEVGPHSPQSATHTPPPEASATLASTTDPASTVRVAPSIAAIAPPLDAVLVERVVPETETLVSFARMPPPSAGAKFSVRSLRAKYSVSVSVPYARPWAPTESGGCQPPTSARWSSRSYWSHRSWRR